MIDTYNGGCYRREILRGVHWLSHLQVKGWSTFRKSIQDFKMSFSEKRFLMQQI